MNAPVSLAQIPGIWRGRTAPRVEAVPTGHAGLDALLPGGGWPTGAVSEVLHERPGIGELSLILPLLASLTQAGGRTALCAPPHVPFASAFAQAGVMLPRLLVVQPPERNENLWGLEQLLRCGVFGAVVCWVTEASDHDLRRVQLAAETGRSIAILLRPLSAEAQFSPAALRLTMRAAGEGRARTITVTKARGGIGGRCWTLA